MRGDQLPAKRGFHVSAVPAVMRPIISAQAALVHVLVAQQFGIQATFTHRGTAINNLWMIPRADGDATARITLGTRSIEERRIFEIATQPNFPPSDGLVVDDVIGPDENGNLYRVERFVNEDDIGAVYKFHGVYESTKQVGVVGQ